MRTPRKEGRDWGAMPHREGTVAGHGRAPLVTGSLSRRQIRGNLKQLEDDWMQNMDLILRKKTHTRITIPQPNSLWGERYDLGEHNKVVFLRGKQKST